VADEAHPAKGGGGAGRLVPSLIAFFGMSFPVALGLFAALAFLAYMSVNRLTPGSEAGTGCAGTSSLTSATISPDIMSRIRQNQSTYEEAGKQANVPWQLMAAIHFREHNNDNSAPPNGQGPWQLKSLYDSARGTGDQATLQRIQDFRESSFLAAKVIQEKSGNKLTYDTTDDTTIKDAAWGYNGRAYGSADRSPYVMNNFDENHKNMPIITRDGGGVDGNDTRNGAFTVYVILVNLTPCEEGSAGEATAETTSRQQVLNWINDGSIKVWKPSVTEDIAAGELKQSTLNLIGAIKAAGYAFQINAAGPRSHPSNAARSLHSRGLAIDLERTSVSGPGDVKSLQKWLYDNRQTLKIDELFGPDPDRCGSGCLNDGKPSGDFDNGLSLHVGVYE
jgi:hypothetical protein